MPFPCGQSVRVVMCRASTARVGGIHIPLSLHWPEAKGRYSEPSGGNPTSMIDRLYGLKIGNGEEGKTDEGRREKGKKAGLEPRRT